MNHRDGRQSSTQTVSRPVGAERDLRTCEYPGDSVNALDLLHLADSYRNAATVLSSTGKRGDLVSRAPYRLAAIHAIELYLGALLLHLGYPPKKLRSLQHDLASRAALAMEGGLVLRRKTARHLSEVVDAREYLVARYDPGAGDAISPLNRLSATLDELASKVRVAIEQHDVR